MRILSVKSLKRVIPFLFCLALIPSVAWAVSYTFETFDVPTAVETWAQGINDSGQVSGYFMLNHTVTPVHGFMRSASGSITTFDYTSADCPFPETRAFAINGSGQVAGYCIGGKYGYHFGFVRSTDGLTYTPIDDPNVEHLFDFDVSGTSATGVNDSGQVTGYYTVLAATHGFLTNSDHTQFTTIDDPSANADTTRAIGINNSGQVTGYYVSGPGYHGFVRNADGSFTQFEVPNSILGYTYAYGINNSGQVVGSYKGADNHFYGFMRSADGLTYSKIDYPSASLTYAYGVNNNGQVTGIYKLTDGIVHGFIATPVVILPVMVVGSPDPYHDTLIEAYGTLDAESTVTIEAQESPVFSGLNLNNTVYLTLLGGYDSEFDEPPTGMTTIHGELTVGSGSLTVSNLVIQ